MTLVVEDGSGVVGANGYDTVASVTSYLTDRGRETENLWSSSSDQEGAVIEATDYIETRFRELFKGTKEFDDLSIARATLTFTSQPIAAETVTLGVVTYTFVSTIAVAGDVLIGDTLADSIDNLVTAINNSPDADSEVVHPDTVENENATALKFIDDALVAFSSLAGTRGNSVVTTETLTSGSWNFVTLNGGSNILVPQPLSFPRANLFDRDGNAIIGMPERLKFAMYEYAVRAVSTSITLAPDPTTDAFGGVVTSIRQKVGPIETATEYLAGTSTGTRLPAYPAADRLLNDFISTGGGSFR